ncbi:restriction endonuclease subunit S [Streptomyces erythrochromogenes]|uniref:restriction endonuclease subunit S n=1 Tax=Streptomyces erythrochromogenes TaxID=285574 RepID=UPI0036F6D3EE
MRAFRIKDVARINRRLLPEETDPEYRFKYIDISAVDGLGGVTIPDDEITFSVAPSRARRLAPPGAVVVSTVRTYLRAIAAVPAAEIPLVFSTGFAVLEAGPHIDARFLAHYCRSQVFVDEVAARSTGVSYPAINPREIGCLPIILPKLEEQRRIADFLDAEVGKLDSIVRSRALQYKLLNERIDSQVVDIIGRSELAAPDVGIPMVAMRWLLQKVMRATAETSEVVTAFRDGQVTARSMRRVEGYTNSASAEPQGQEVLVGDIVVHGLDGFAGAIGASEAAGNCSPVYHVMIPRGASDSLYYGRLLRILALQGYLTGFSHSTRERAFDFRNWDMFGRIPLPVAHENEQRRIGDQIRMVTPLRSKLTQFSERITERSQALITAAVTGQFDVSTAGGSNVTEGITV